MSGCRERVGALVITLVVALVACSNGSDGDGAGAGRTSTTVAGVPPAAVPGSDSEIPVRVDMADRAWPMHTIDNRFKGANSLGAGDVNGDGLTDYVTNYEFDQRYVVALHPPDGADVRAPWPTVTAFVPDPLELGTGINTENAALADVDGDGNVDVVGAQGLSDIDFWEGSQPGVRIVWGPPAAKAADPTAWTDGGRVPASVDVGHLHWVTTADLDGDGTVEVLAGGRVHEENGSKAGIAWYEAPKAGPDRRNLDRWVRHPLAPDEWSGHGFVLGDIDQDGDDDVAVANADFDTPAAAEAVLWYENPGPRSPKLAEPWKRHELYRGDEFHTKPQVQIADVDGDGLTDLAVQTPEAVYWFRKTRAPARFERIVIPKAESAQHLARTFRIADVDGDGRNDFVGMLVHEDGDLPYDRAAVFWMRNPGGAQDVGWDTHVVKWGSGHTALITEFGEKYDMADVRDVDGDGDLDIVANNEEWWADGGAPTAFYEPHAPAVHAVVWFENRLGDAPTVHRARSGKVRMEAEQPTAMLDGGLVPRAVTPVGPPQESAVADYAGASGDQFVQATEAVSKEPLPHSASRGNTYEFRGLTGPAAVWMRVWVPPTWGAGLGGARSDAVWVQLDAAPPVVVGDSPGVPTGAWTWVRAAERDLTADQHSLTIATREGGLAVDQILVQSSDAAPPA